MSKPIGEALNHGGVASRTSRRAKPANTALLLPHHSVHMLCLSLLLVLLLSLSSCTSETEVKNERRELRVKREEERRKRKETISEREEVTVVEVDSVYEVEAGYPETGE